MFNFKSSLAQGHAGEQRMLSLFPNWKRTDGRKEDFIMPNGHTVELKAEQRSTIETPNLAVELESSPGRPGALERAVNDDITYIVFLYSDGNYFTYKPQELLNFTKSNSFRIVKVQNPTYETTVALVPRRDVQHLEVQLSTLIGSNNADYHSNRTHLSSSGLKLLLQDPHSFYARYVLGNHVEEYKAAYADGTLLHSLVLEPELFTAQYALFPGLRKAGKQFDDFKAQHANKNIISAPQLSRAEKWRDSCKRHAIANRLLSDGISEFTMLGELMSVKLKSRADKINTPLNYIVDLKTTSAFTDADVFRQTATDFGYGLSAALYCEMYHQNFGAYPDFYWVVVSKQDGHCAVYKASAETLAIGRADVMRAISLYKRCLETGLWQLDQPTNRFQAEEEITEI